VSVQPLRWGDAWQQGPRCVELGDATRTIGADFPLQPGAGTEFRIGPDATQASAADCEAKLRACSQFAG
jgi:hypothetical protein